MKEKENALPSGVCMHRHGIFGHWKAVTAIFLTHWLRFRQDGTQEIYFQVPSTTTPTTILVAVIKAHRNRKTKFNAKTNRNHDLQKTGVVHFRTSVTLTLTLTLALT